MKQIYKTHVWTVVKQILFNFMKDIDDKSFSADKPGRMNTKFIRKSTSHNVQHTNNKMGQYNVEVFEEDSLMTRNNSDVAPEH